MYDTQPWSILPLTRRPLKVAEREVAEVTQQLLLVAQVQPVGPLPLLMAERA